jgi:hypothetical protein
MNRLFLSGDKKMLPIKFVEKHLQWIDPRLLEIVLELRNLIVSVAPDATEDVARKGFTYYDKKRGGHVSAGICQVRILSSEVELAFVHGAFLPDPQGLLHGTGKAMRYVRIHSYELAPWDALKSLIRASHQFDPYTQQFRSD